MCVYCSEPAAVGPLCVMHDNRKRKGAIDMHLPRQRRRGSNSYVSLNKPISYDSAHHRPRWLWGWASNYPCIDCGGRAKDWSYCGGDPTELTGPNNRGVVMAYSIWPEFYAPRCRSCHGKFDGWGTYKRMDDEPPW